jgi:hypothetical protein
MAISIDNLRRGNKYRLINHGEQFEFQVVEIEEEGVYIIKDLFTLEKLTLNDLLRYGKGKDYDLEEL